MEKCITITTACDKLEVAQKIRSMLLNKHLIACGQIIKMNSEYWWQGSLENTDEYLLQLKTRKSLFEAVRDEILNIHDYVTCEIIAYDMAATSRDFYDWIIKETKQC